VEEIRRIKGIELKAEQRVGWYPLPKSSDVGFELRRFPTFDSYNFKFNSSGI
jgi:hypothetical protein